MRLLNHNVSLDTILSAQAPEAPDTPQDQLNRLAVVLVNIQNKPQSMTIRPVTTTPMTSDGKSEKFELFEDLFHTMIKMQPVMTEQMKINHFHFTPCCERGHCKHLETQTPTTVKHSRTCWLYSDEKRVKLESQATAKHKSHRLTFEPNTMKLPDFLEELNQGT